MKEVYPSSQRDNTRYRGVSYHRPISAAKETVPVFDLAAHLCGLEKMRREGQRWVARCPLPGHDDRTPSFKVFPATQSWYCFGACCCGGDVVDLAAAAWGYDAEGGRGLAIAAAELLLLFGYELPKRPDTWFRRQERQKPTRDRVAKERIEHVREIVYRLMWMPWLRTLPGSTREAAEDDAWETSLWMATRLYDTRRGA